MVSHFEVRSLARGVVLNGAVQSVLGSPLLPQQGCGAGGKGRRLLQHRSGSRSVSVP